MSSHSFFWPLKRYFLWPGSREADFLERLPSMVKPAPIPVEKVT